MYNLKGCYLHSNIALFWKQNLCTSIGAESVEWQDKLSGGEAQKALAQRGLARQLNIFFFLKICGKELIFVQIWKLFLYIKKGGKLYIPIGRRVLSF